MKKIYHQVELIVCDCYDYTASCIASILEQFGCRVIKHRVGSAADFISLLRGTNIFEGTNFIILCAHGDNVNGVKSMSVICNDKEEIDYTNEMISEFSSIEDIPILCTGCNTGCPEFAKAFFDGGCKTYIAPSGDIAIADIIRYLTNLFYEIIQNKKDIISAHKKVKEELNYNEFVLFSKKTNNIDIF